MDVDRTELNDLAGTNAPLEERLQRDYLRWEEACGVEEWSTIEQRFLDAFGMKDIHG